MAVSELVRAELARHDWTVLRCVCGGSAEHLPLLFETLLTAGTPQDAFGYSLDGHVECDTVIDECTPPAVGVILAALAGEVSPTVRREFLDTLVRVSAGSDFSGTPSGDRVGGECRALAQEGFWVLLRIGLDGSAEDADAVADICECFDLGDRKSTYYQALLRDRVRARTKRRTALRRST
ncbi:hypothetical protein ACFC6U_35490 [Kitasatospora purpeofusca]|uniref:hypothetical protein n=1 Tax=Kitasatospora purpeofusca TaxID=67352 RepID=UPI0035DE6F44